jgi:hypothetical protein
MDLKGSDHGLTEILSLHLAEGKKDQLSLPPASADFSFGLNVNPEDGDNIFLRNVGLYPKYPKPEDRNIHRMYELKFNQNI